MDCPETGIHAGHQFRIYARDTSAALHIPPEMVRKAKLVVVGGVTMKNCGRDFVHEQRVRFKSD